MFFALFPETSFLPRLLRDPQPECRESCLPNEPAFSEESSTERRNLLVLMAHQVLFRIAWIFKTESVLMPAFLDSITSYGWVSGLLPPLNRLGQSVTPLLLSGRLRETPLKSRWLPRTTMLMGIPFVILSVLVAWRPIPDFAMPAAFLILYGLFFATTGTNQTVYNTVQGKLISPHRRGRLMAIAGSIGSPGAILCALVILRPWVRHDPPRFAAIFLFTGGMFIAAGFLARLLTEQPDLPKTDGSQRPHPFRDALRHLRRDRDLRRVCVLSSLVASTMVVFPYYQRLGRSLAGFETGMLMTWVISQNLGAALFSWIAGRIADRRGTRSALRMLTFASLAAPLIPLLLQRLGTAHAYWITFIWLGTVPVTFRMKMNYVLELTRPGRHPIYVSTAALATTPVILLSPLAGLLTSRVGYAVPFCLVSAAGIAAWIMTLRITEPRRTRSSAAPDQAVSAAS